MKHWLAIAAVLYTANQLKSAECNVACMKGGYDAGYYTDSAACACVELKEYERFTHQKKLTIPSRSDQIRIHPEITPYWRDHDHD